MSLILDALNRSRGEQDEVPTLGTRHDYVGQRSAAWVWGLLLALLAAVLLIAWLLWERAAEPPVELAAPSPVVSQIPDPEPQPIAPAPARPPQSPTPPAEAAPPTKPLTAATLPVADVQPVGEGPASLPASEPRPDVSALYDREPRPAQSPAVAAQETSEPESPAGPTVDDRGVDIEQLVRQAEDDLENARLAEHPAPFISALSQQAKDPIPSILYARHDYSGRPGQSIVVLNGKEMKAGGSPASGVKVVEILPDSVVLDYRGTQFRLRALNSWVNL